MSTFVAKYSGKCFGGCSGIEPGDEVRYVDLFGKDLMHVDCENSEGLREELPPAPPCTTCWLYHPPGSCDL